MKLKAGGKALIGLVIVSTVGFVGYKFDGLGYFDVKPTIPASVPQVSDLPRGDISPAPAQPSTAPGSVVAMAPAASDGEIKMQVIPWNGTLGLLYANGGSKTTSGSLMAKRGVKLSIERQDMYDQMLSEQVKFAKAVSEGQKMPRDGVAFVVIMGDGYPAYIAGAQEALGKLGQQLQVVGAVGYSRGEDKCIIDAKANPRGSLIGAVLRDGDWNICVQWAADNGVPINPDEKTYDPSAMNFVAVDSFTVADEKFITGACETRPVVNSGQPTGGRQKVCVNGTATWTPGDVKVAREYKGGLRVLASTKEYRWQMPATVIGNKQWMSQNRALVENFLAAAFEGGETVRSDATALAKAGSIAAAVFKEEDGAYWAKYAKGVVERDRAGNSISLGGSTQIGLGDNLFLFGLNGNDQLYKRIYGVFGGYVVKYYPDIVSKLVPYEQVVDASYIKGIASKSTVVAEPEKPTYTPSQKATGTFAQRSVSIEFETGRASFTPAAVVQLNALLDELSVSGLTVQLNGHTDSVGDPQSNLTLSRARANAVAQWLSANAGSSFPAERIRARGYGDTQPIADNKTNDGRAKNRRVEVILLTTE